MSRRWFAILLVSASAALGCNSEAPAEKPRPARKSKVTSAKSPPKVTESPSIDAPNIPTSDHYGLPFAWEKADDEPLGQTRTFLSEVLRDNGKYLERGKAYFLELSRPQKPRATVITCADSRVQSQAWDATPENDDFTIRNIGNQVGTAMGSVQYGVEHLNTPVLLILGHTGCGAVKAVLDQAKDLPKSIQQELQGIKLAPAGESKKRDSAWANAVVENVHHQVRAALDKFGSRIVTGKLTVIGGVYDLNDDFGKGGGRISIVDVTGNSEQKRLQAFVAAVQESLPKIAAQSAAPDGDVAVPNSETVPAAPAQSASNPVIKGDELQAAFVDIPGLITKEATKAAH
jgi:carbonic anhydrase